MIRFSFLHIILLIICNVAFAAKPVHVIITAGQSNTDGRVKNIKLPTYIKELGTDNKNYADGTYKFCKISQNRSDGKFIPFWPMCTRTPDTDKWAYDAVTYYLIEKHLKENFYVIKWAVGGTSIAPNLNSTTGRYWCPDEKWLANNKSTANGGQSLLLSFTEQIDACIDSTLAKIEGGYKIDAFLWHQGESDQKRGKMYYDNIKRVVSYVRNHLSNKTGKDYSALPFIFGTVSKVNKSYDAEVERGMRKFAAEDKNVYLIDMSDGELQEDGLHFTEKSAEYLGKQMYNILSGILKKNTPLYSTSLENLSRGLIGIPSGNDMYLSWRMFPADKRKMKFDIYRTTQSCKEIKLNKKPIVNTSDFIDANVDFLKDNTWILKSDGKEIARWERMRSQEKNPYISIPIRRPDGGNIAGEDYVYKANDCSVGDLDGDGEYEIILKWDPSNSKRPPQKGYTANTYLDAYKINGTFLWRIDLGPNIRSGAATTNFLVYDFDGDGMAELCCKTGDGTVDGIGNMIGQKDKDWRTADMKSPTYGKIVNGPEYITIFEGSTGRVLDSKEYIPTRYPLDGWGGVGGNCGNDNTGGRSDRFSACVAYLDGKSPSAVMVRGWYGRTVAVAWSFKNGQLKSDWTFDSSLPGLEGYSGMGNHSVTVADFDNDGCDEVCVGAMTIDNDGKGLYTTGLRHGDALHAGRFIPHRKGMQVFGVHENEGDNPIVKRTPAVAMFDGNTGEIIWQDGLGADAGRGVAADIDPRYDGYECWTNRGGLRRSDNGELICDAKPNSCNFFIYWDADPLMELLDHTSISKWNWKTEKTDLLFKAEGVVSNNGTKGNCCLSGDILGDWREEVIWASADQKELRIYSTTIKAENRRPTLMSDRQYRLAIAWQNVGYNQPPHVGK